MSGHYDYPTFRPMNNVIPQQVRGEIVGFHTMAIVSTDKGDLVTMPIVVGEKPFGPGMQVRIECDKVDDTGICHGIRAVHVLGEADLTAELDRLAVAPIRAGVDLTKKPVQADVG